MRLDWLPWKFILRRVARSQGLLDPVRLLSQINAFAQPSEVAAPMELVRYQAVFHARGLINARTIQSNLDWVWPYWVRRQFDPLDPAFVPRSYTLTHVNLTHRNWTALGLPDLAAYPIVDPRGLTTPFFDGWSLDGWIITNDGRTLLPPDADQAEQWMVIAEDRLGVRTVLTDGPLRLTADAEVAGDDGGALCRIRFRPWTDEPGVFAVVLRPCNPEGISFIHRIALEDDGRTWRVNGLPCVALDRPVGRHLVSSYPEGDVFHRILDRGDRREVSCRVGMASAAALFDLRPGTRTEISVEIDLSQDPGVGDFPDPAQADVSWSEALAGACRFRVPDERFRYLYDAALRAVILHTPKEVYPGPFYYKRFWFRDAVFILYPMLCLGLHRRARRVLEGFFPRQSMAGYFHSQDGEWDSNGQVMWIIEKYAEFTGESIPGPWAVAVARAGKWIRKKRLSPEGDERHAGLLPAGFSAEHFGNNDFYFWDDFWAVAGLRAGSRILARGGDAGTGESLRAEAENLMGCIERSLFKSGHIRRHDGIPASPHRRMDAGAIGSLVAGYPLRLWGPDDPRLLHTVGFLREKCFIDGAFFQDISHSGFNPYLTLHCAQTLLRAGDPGFFSIVEAVARLASPTGQWPEAVHPRTLGGCQGDGQHIWAAAEWLMMVRNMFVREEEEGLVLLGGIPENWLRGRESLEMGVVHTEFGPMTIRVTPTGEGIRVEWSATWRDRAPRVAIHLPGRPPVTVENRDRFAEILPIPRERREGR